MTKVCHMTSAHTSADTRIFHKECVSLAGAGYEVYLVAPGESREDKGVHVIGVGKKPGSRLKRMMEIAKKVYTKALELDCDIYHFHDPELLPYGVKLKKRGKKVIFDSHENYSVQILEKGYLSPAVRKLVSIVYKWYETRCVQRLDAVIVPCTMNGKNFFENRANKTVFIDNYPLLSEIQCEVIANKPTFQIIYVGGLTYGRGITHLMRAAHQANVKLILAGGISPLYLKELQEEEGFSCVDYRGLLTRQEVVEVLKESSVGMATLLKIGQYGNADNLPTKVLEYMGVGLPVIVTNYPYAKKVIENYQCGICVEPDNIDEISSAIKYLLDNPGTAQRMGMNGRKAVVDEYNWEKQQEVLLTLYRTLKNE